MFESDKINIMNKGFIAVRELHQGRYVPDTPADHAVLVAVVGRGGFAEAEYDDVLQRVSADPWNLGLGVIIGN